MSISVLNSIYLIAIILFICNFLDRNKVKYAKIITTITIKLQLTTNLIKLKLYHTLNLLQCKSIFSYLFL